MTPADAIKLYLHLRDVVQKELTETYEAKKSEIDDAKKELERFFMQTMDERGESSIKTADGIAFLVTQMRVKMVDRDAFTKYVEDTHDFRMVTSHVSKDGVKEYMDEYAMAVKLRPDTNMPPTPPGVEVTEFVSCNVRKA
jgi:hypothetical protein